MLINQIKNPTLIYKFYHHFVFSAKNHPSKPCSNTLTFSVQIRGILNKTSKTKVEILFKIHHFTIMEIFYKKGEKNILCIGRNIILFSLCCVIYIQQWENLSQKYVEQNRNFFWIQVRFPVWCINFPLMLFMNKNNSNFLQEFLKFSCNFEMLWRFPWILWGFKDFNAINLTTFIQDFHENYVFSPICLPL